MWGWDTLQSNCTEPQTDFHGSYIKESMSACYTVLNFPSFLQMSLILILNLHEVDWVLWIRPRLSVCPSVLFFQNWFIGFFWFFCKQLGDHKWRKVTEPDFSGKIPLCPFCAKRGKNGQKWGFLTKIQVIIFCLQW